MNYQPPSTGYYMSPESARVAEERRAAYSLMNINQYPQRPIPIRPEDEYMAANALMDMSDIYTQMYFGDEHEGPPPIVRQNAVRGDPDSIMYDFRKMSFGRAHDSVVCPPGKKRNPKYRPNRRGKFQGRRPCIKDKGPRVTLSELQDVARANNVSIFARRKDGKGFTKKPLT